MRLRMPGLLTCAAAAGGVGLAYGAWRIGRFIYGIKKYRDSAKAAALSADGFRLAGISGQAKTLKWFVIDDQVMGGRSSSAITPTAKGFIEFAGSINTNGGGFSSCRTLGDDEPLGIAAEAKFIEVTAVADSRQYKLTLHTADSWQMSVPTWAHDFRSEAPGQQQTWKLPLSDFTPSKQGRPVPGAVLDPSKITGVGINLSLYTMHGKPNPHFGDGPFKITLESLAVQ
mmetsp:Transcript_107404/g.190196  ORF Transcript_107404/g.190196 Transcript_107404/m.190196 type:complete len:228 (+) Transcript_107404:66-749(+)